MPVFEITLDDGRVLEVDAVDQTAALAGVEHFRSQPQAEKPSTGMFDAFKQGIANTASGLGETLKQYGGLNEADAALKAGASSVAPKNYDPAQVVTKDGVNLEQLPRAVVEQSPAIAAAITAARLGAKLNPKLGLLAGAGAGAAVSLGGYAKNRAATRTGDVNAEPTFEDKAAGIATAVPVAALDMIGLNRFLPGAGTVKAVGAKGASQALGQAGKTIAIEGGTEGLQTGVEQAGASLGTPGGLKLDPYAIANDALVGGGAGGAFATPKLGRDVAGSVKYREFGGDSSEASSAVANRIQAAAGDGDLKNSKTGFEAVRRAESDIKTELSAAVTALKAETDLSPDAVNALKAAQTGKGVNSDDLATLDAAVGSTPSADLVKGLARQASILTKLKGKGDFNTARKRFAGGAGNALEKHVRALQNPLGAGAAGLLSAAGLSGNMAAMFTAAPPALAAIGGVYGGARVLDRITGARSPARQFAERFADPSVSLRPPVVQPDPPPPVAPPVVNDAPWGPRPPGPSVPSVPLETPDTSKLPPGFQSLLDTEVRNQNRETLAETQRAQQAQRSHQREVVSLLRALQAQQKAKALANATPEPVPMEQTPERVPADVLRNSRSLMRALASVDKLRTQTEGSNQAQELAANSPFLEQLVGGPEGVPSAPAGKEISRMLSHAKALAKLQSDPEAEQAEQAAVKADAASQKAAEKAQKQEAVLAKRALDKLSKAAPAAPVSQPEAPSNSDALANVHVRRTRAVQAFNAASKSKDKGAVENARAEFLSVMGELRAIDPSSYEHFANLPGNQGLFPELRAKKADVDQAVATVPEVTSKITKTNGAEPHETKKPAYDPAAGEDLVSPDTGETIRLRQHSAAAEKTIEDAVEHTTRNYENSESFKGFRSSRDDFKSYVEAVMTGKAQMAEKLAAATGIDDTKMVAHLWAIATKEQARETRADLKRFAPQAATAIDSILSDEVITRTWRSKGASSKPKDAVTTMAKKAKAIADVKAKAAPVVEAPAPPPVVSPSDNADGLDIPTFLRRTR